MTEESARNPRLSCHRCRFRTEEVGRFLNSWEHGAHPLMLTYPPPETAVFGLLGFVKVLRAGVVWNAAL